MFNKKDSIIVKIRKVWNRLIGPYFVIILLGLSFLFSTYVFILGINNTQAEYKMYEADCTQLHKLRKEYFELKELKYSDEARIEKIRAKIRILERRCKEY